MACSKRARTQSERVNTDEHERFIADSGNEEHIQAEICVKFADLNILDSDIENITNNIKQALLSSADKVFGKERRKNQLWTKKTMKEDIEVLIEEQSNTIVN
ncbi:hypothetical protein DPMN_158916 [Dreissena polymorpha]|uniref:Uncharacterized protein n=1 Tax=Dreissena polymorpha TaxID=45954 RepID=A0A9D4EMA2_DREPO|nr:hypothetical protein DPMN_158916 [Dreissena polymorpha]